MTVYDDFAHRQRGLFLLFANAVMGEKVIAMAASANRLESLRWSRVYEFKTAFKSVISEEMQRYSANHIRSTSGLFVDRMEMRIKSTLNDIESIVEQIVKSSNRELAGANVVDTLTKDGGAIGKLAQRKFGQTKPKVKDSAGRFWEAEKLVFTIMRNFAYQTFIDSEFESAILNGATEVRLDHPDKNHPMVGVVIAIKGSDWLVLRDATFHINSRLTVTHGTVSA